MSQLGYLSDTLFHEYTGKQNLRETTIWRIAVFVSPIYVQPNEARRGVRVAHGWLAFGVGLLLNLAMAVASHAQTFSVLASFDGTDGITPLASLVQGANGDFYSTAVAGGANWCGCGTIFKVTPEGKLSALYSFCSQPNCTDGTGPSAALLLDANGDFYGTIPYGGNPGGGAVFKINAAGTLTTVYNFCSVNGPLGCLDGEAPLGSLVAGEGGDLYGTTSSGGANNYGTVFKITAAGALTTLYSFCSLPLCADGSQPESALVWGTDGNLYGTTSGGGAYGGEPTPYYGGTVFKLTPAGKLTTLYSFCSKMNSSGWCTDGSGPGGVIQASDGNLYGTTHSGGAAPFVGTVFKIKSGKLETLHSFGQSGADGADPYFTTALIQATDGNFYGTTSQGGEYADGTLGGTVYKITPAGKLTVLHSFCAPPLPCLDGSNPEAPLLQGTDGDFYGTASEEHDTVFKLSTGLGHFVTTVPTFRKVGEGVTILGTDLTGATSVTFNGTAATVTAVSATSIKTTVPAGATTGYVEVTTPSGTLKSNAVFTVTP